MKTQDKFEDEMLLHEIKKDNPVKDIPPKPEEESVKVLKEYVEEKFSDQWKCNTEKFTKEVDDYKAKNHRYFELLNEINTLEKETYNGGEMTKDDALKLSELYSEWRKLPFPHVETMYDKSRNEYDLYKKEVFRDDKGEISIMGTVAGLTGDDENESLFGTVNDLQEQDERVKEVETSKDKDSIIKRTLNFFKGL